MVKQETCGECGMQRIQNKYVGILGKLIGALLFVILGMAALSSTMIFLQGQSQSPFCLRSGRLKLIGELSMLLYALFMMLLIQQRKSFFIWI